MNSNFFLAGSIALSIYLLSIFALLVYFNIYKTKTTVGKVDSFSISIVSKEPPQPVEQEKKQIKAVQEPTQIEVVPQEQTPPQNKTITAPRASISDIFQSVTPSKTQQTTQQSVQYESSYQSQNIQSRDEVTIHSLKDVTISSVQGGDVYDELVIEFQEFLYSRWNPPSNVGLHESVLIVRVKKDGAIDFKISMPSPSDSFNRYVRQFVDQVKYFKPIERDLNIELILKTEE